MKKTILPLIALLFLLSACGESPQSQLPAVEEPVVVAPTTQPEPVPESTPEPEPEPTTIHILGAGDNLIHTGIFLQGAKRATDGGYDFTFTYENVADIIAAADFASINQESMMANMEPSSYPRFNAPQQVGEEIVSIGFDLISLSNNHMFDKGEAGLQDTMDFLQTQDALVTGAYYDQEDYLDIPTATINGITLAFVSATQPTNGLSLPSDSEIIAPLIPDDVSPLSENQAVNELIAQTRRAAEISDVVVANIHWGNEYTHIPTSFQTQVAQLLAEAGADIIFGHHPHVLQPIEYLTREDGTQAVVCYSLGNFISCQDQGARMIGGLMDVAITQQLDGTITLDQVQLLPVITQYGTNFSNVTIYPYSQYSQELALSHGVRENTSSFSMDYIYTLVTDVIDPQFLPQDFLTQYGPT